MNKVGPEDKARLTEYLDGMRDVERRIQMAEQQTAREFPSVERPAGVPSEFADHLKLMFDLQVLAFQTDMTRMITFMTGPEQSNRTYREIGIPDVHQARLNLLSPATPTACLIPLSAGASSTR